MTYNGHKDYEHWNVALWLYNNEALYALVQEHIHYTSLYAAAEALWAALPDDTPDGVEYTIERIEAAIGEDYADHHCSK